MVEDRLDRDERIRLESLNQAIASTMGTSFPTRSIMARAFTFEDYIRNGKTVGDEITNA
jgi:hypothetical protein